MISTKKWVAIIGVILLLSAGAALYLSFRGASGTVANVYQDGKCIYSVDLSEVEEPFTLSVSCEDGTNTIAIEPGRICIQDADCPDQVCVKSGWLKNSASPIVCLPHKLVIRLENSPDSANTIDAVAK
ncbi:MAG: NusG domain II-containing protein [Oscillospiraceae bacterium]|nr:NusG domain II-containing protein [Oscillospiraceae bacterium]